MSSDCLFCRIARGEIPSTPVYSDEAYYAFRDINPAAPTHILVVPRRHVERISDAQDADAEMLGRLFITANQIARSENLTDFRYVINCGPRAGQSVYHIHLHLLAGRDLDWPPG
ncbi:MAG: putative HIT-like protein [Candidatus Hydrogenedentota bacterium]